MSGYLYMFPIIVASFWGNSLYQWFFYISLAIVFFIEKDKMKKQVFFWYPLLIYLVMISPIAYFVGIKVWGWGSPAQFIAYICRQFSLIPVFYVIAFAVTLLCKITSKGLKLALVAIACLLLSIGGSKYIYANENIPYYKSDSAYKIPKDLITLCDYMDSLDEDPVVAMHTDLSYQARQYDASLHLIISFRDYSTLSDELGAENPNVAYIMSTVCSRGGDFVIVPNKETVGEAFLNAGYNPCCETETLLLYECSGYPGVKNEYNEKDQIVALRYYDENGAPRVVNEGYASLSRVYDKNDDAVEEYYYDTDGNPITLSLGYYCVKSEYNKNHQRISDSYYDENGNLVTLVSGQAIVHYGYDSVGNRNVYRYYDADNNPILFWGQYFCTKYEFNDNRWSIRQECFGTDENPIVLGDGASGYKWEYDSEGNATLTTNIGVDGNPVNNTFGYASVRREFNEYRYIMREEYLDTEGNPIALEGGQTSVTYERDDAGNVIKVIYYDLDGNVIFEG